MANLEKYLGGLPIGELERGKKFELDSKKWLLEDTLWASLIESVWTWDEWPGRWGRDAGIDLVVLTKDGELWAVQNKCFGINQVLKKSDIDTFLSESSRATFSRRIIIATTNNLSSTLKKTLVGQEKPVTLILGNDLEESEVNWDSYVNRVTPARVTGPSHLRPYQSEAIKKVMQGFSQNSKGKLIMACGTGKTFVSLKIHEELNSKLTVVCVPTLTLLSQSLRAWLGSRKTTFKWLAVCSDDSVTKDSEGLKARLIDFAFTATTSVEKIQDFVSQDGPKVIFTTYKSSNRVAEALSATPIDLLVADEAHRLAGKRNVTDTTLFFESALRIHKILFQTATPRIFGEGTKASAKVQGLELIDMGDEDFFGPTFFEYTFREAIQDGWLSPYQVVIGLFSEKDVIEQVTKRNLLKLSEELYPADYLAKHICLNQAIAKYNLARVISFHTSIPRAQRFISDHSKLFQENYITSLHSKEIESALITGYQPTSERVRTLKRLAEVSNDKTFIVSNARCLTEGIDVPELDAITFIDPRYSKVDIVQAVGRAIRLGGKGKSVGTIIIPVFVDSVQEAENELDKSEYSRVYEVIKALEMNDESLAMELASIRESIGSGRGKARLPKGIVLLSGTEIPEKFVDSFNVEILRRVSSSWDEYYGELLKWTETHGHSRVPQVTSREGEKISLGVWVAQQRVNYSKGLLSKERIEKLEKVEGWTFNPLEDDWNLGVSATREAISKFGAWYLIDMDYVHKGINIRRWLNSCKTPQRRKQMSKEQNQIVKELLGDMENARDIKWNLGYEAAKLWLASNIELPGDEVVIPRTNTKLLNWFKVNLRMYRLLKKSKAQSERCKKLEQLPHWSEVIKWYQPSRKVFEFQHGGVKQEVVYDETKLSHLKPVQRKKLADYLGSVSEYSKEFGTTRHPQSVGGRTFRFRGFGLGQTLNSYITRREDLDRSVIEILESIPGWTWDKDLDSWQRAFELLIQYQAEFETAQVSQGEVYKDFPLGNWVARQRDRKRGKKNTRPLTEYELQKLQELKDWKWESSKDRKLGKRNKTWEQNFKLLESYANENGHCEVPEDCIIEGVTLGIWVRNQKYKIRGTGRGYISKEESGRLIALPGGEVFKR